MEASKQTKIINKNIKINNSQQVTLPNIYNSKNVQRNFWTEPCDPNESKMSGGSDLDQFEDISYKKLKKEEEGKDDPFKNKYNLTESAPESIKIDYSKYNDEWDAVNMYNKRLYEEQIKREKIKDWQIKQRTKHDLDIQIKQKIKKKYLDKIKEMEYDEIVEKYLKRKDELEAKKKEDIKKLVIKEREMRDAQIKEQNMINRINYLKNKKYERELVEQNKKDLLEDKLAIINRRKKEKEEMEKTLKENELHQKILKEQAEKEREDDIKIMEDHNKVEEKKENERRAYFDRIKKQANSFGEKAVETVLKAQKEKEAIEEENMNQYNLYKEQQAKEEEFYKLQKIRDNKIKYRKFLDKQVAERLRQKTAEKEVDLVQGKIWKKDAEIYKKHEADVRRIIRDMYRQNLKALDEQVKMGKNSVDKGMSNYEKLINKEALKEAQ